MLVAQVVQRERRIRSSSHTMINRVAIRLRLNCVCTRRIKVVLLTLFSSGAKCVCLAAADLHLQHVTLDHCSACRRLDLKHQDENSRACLILYPM